MLFHRALDFKLSCGLTSVRCRRICTIWLWLRLHGAIYRPDSFISMLHYCANLKAIRFESTSLDRIVADKLHRVIVAYIVSLIDFSFTT